MRNVGWLKEHLRDILGDLGKSSFSNVFATGANTLPPPGIDAGSILYTRHSQNCDNAIPLIINQSSINHQSIINK